MRGGNILNSRSEYNRCQITRLTIEAETEESKKMTYVENNEEVAPEDCLD